PTTAPKETPSAVAVASPTPAPTKVAAATPSPTPAPTPAPTPTPTPAAAKATATPAEPPRPGTTEFASSSIGVRVVVPDSWKGSTDEENGIISLRTPQGVEIRLARDPGSLRLSEVTTAMKVDKWDVYLSQDKARAGTAGVLPGETIYAGAEMKKDTSYVNLSLIDRPDKSTIVVYSSTTAKFTKAQKEEIADLVGQIIRQSLPPKTP
ncbi:MAG: hypothetical protein K1X53_03945, partial [Candidatus Sumerlaeaceae bacterium]|nr:hypothetical protein [Candidatus Sumerlaeaceae bacterium]